MAIVGRPKMDVGPKKYSEELPQKGLRVWEQLGWRAVPGGG